MIISHKYKYVFIELSRTASEAISCELCEFYAGERILWKHASYRDFEKIAGSKEKKYFIFSGIRNPLDAMISLYFFHRQDPFKKFGVLKHKFTNLNNYKQFWFIKNNNVDFLDFFKKFYGSSIYYEWKTKDFDKLNYIYRFENLQDDFREILKRLKIKQVRPLPVINQSFGRRADIYYYFPAEIQGIAGLISRDYMKKWGYRFSVDWQQPASKEWLYYYLFLKPKFFLQTIYHWFFDQSFFYPSIYGGKKILSVNFI